MAIKNERKIRVAIVGTGMAGLATAYLLSHDKQNRYVVTLFEKVSVQSSVSPVRQFRPNVISL